MEVRKYKKGEEKALWQLFYSTVHRVNSKDYSREQIDAWAPEGIDINIAIQKIREIDPYVVILNSNIVAYADIQKNGYIDHFFCHHDYQGQGVGSFLYAKLESVAIQSGITDLSADVSITARKFFELKGFTVVKEQLVPLRGQKLVNYKMERCIGHS